MLPALAVLTVASFLSALAAARVPSAGSYYFAQYRAFEFLVGVLLAIPENQKEPQKSLLFDVVFLTGLSIIFAGVLGVSTTSHFPGIGAIVPCGGTLLVIYEAAVPWRFIVCSQTKVPFSLAREQHAPIQAMLKRLRNAHPWSTSCIRMTCLARRASVRLISTDCRSTASTTIIT